MGWSVAEVRQMRTQLQEEDKKKQNQAAATAAGQKSGTVGTQKSGTTAAASGARKSGTTTAAGSGWTPQQVAQMRAELTGSKPAAARSGTGNAAKELGDQVLAEFTGTPTGSAVKTDRQEDYEPDWNYAGNDNTPKQRAIAQGTYGSYAKAAQTTGNVLSQDRKTDRFDELNQWMDADPRHRELVKLMRMTENQLDTDTGIKETDWASQDTGSKKAKYSPGALLKMGYTAQEINDARAYMRDYDALPLADRAARRTADTAKGIGTTVAAAVPLAGEAAVQSAKDVAATWKAESTLNTELAGDARAKELKDLITAVDMDYKPQYTDADLVGMGYSQDEVDDMRGRVAGTTVKTALDPDKSIGYQLYDYGQKRTAAAQAGLSDEGRAALGIVSSTAENLAVAGISPALVLPVLSAQGAAESMGRSMEKGESAGTALGTGLAKFGAGWAINSVGVADLAKTMGSDYARDTLAGQLADWVRKAVDNPNLTGGSRLLANTLSGGADNAMQAFVETYADTAIDAVLGGDQEAADALLKPETFWQAVQSGLTGGASGALGGAVGTGLGAMSQALEGQTPTAAAAQADTESRAADAAAAQRALEERAMEPGEMAAQNETAQAVQEQTAVNDDPAVHTPAQNASIAQYKDSVDPKMAEYVDRVRAGEQLAPYMVTETSDKMRSAMQELTGLDKVGSVTMLDANGVNHITNRHAGGDGSADATMKESADVARAAYVLNNFDNAYLAKDRADGYMTSNGKRAPIVIFEKKIDGSHIVVEAVCDTKKNKNFIVSEYLAKNGVDSKEIAKVLRSPVNAVTSPGDNVRNVVADPSAIPMAEVLQPSMDAVADPRDTSETLSADPSAGDSRGSGTKFAETGVKSLSETPLRSTSETTMQRTGSSPDETPAITVTQETGKVNGNAVENAGESVESQAEPTDLKRTAGLQQQALTEKQRSVQRELTNWKVSKGAAETISRMVPDSIADLGTYTAAASSMYRMGQMDSVKTFDKALELAGGMNSLAPNTNYVLQQPGGEQALRAAFLQGQGEVEAGTVERGMLGGALTEKSTSGEGRVIWKGSDRAADDVATKVIELNAAGTGTDAILKSVLKGPDGSPSERVKGYIDTETGRIFFGDRNTDVFSTVLHEDYHWYNALDADGAKALQDTALEYLARNEGFENVDEMIREKLKDYAAQNLTYDQAAEELVADSWSGIFESPEDMTRWAEFQRAQAEKNAGKAGTIHKVMTAVKEMLNSIIGRAKEVLARDPENRAALKAQRLAEAEKRALQDAYFAHAEKAMDNLRAAKENAAALKTEGAAQGVRFRLQEGEETLEKQLNDHLEQLSEMEPVSDITGKEIAYGATNKENAENIVKFFESIGGKVERAGFGVVELSRKGAKATVQHGNGPVKQVAAAAIPDVIQYGQQIGFVENWKGRGYNTYTFVAPVTVGKTTVYEAVVVNEYRSTKQGNKFYVHEVCGSDGSLLVLDDAGNIKQKQESADTVLKTEEGVERPGFPADTTIAQTSAESKENNASVQKSVRYQLAEQADREARKNDQRQASRDIAGTAAALDTLSQFFGVTRGVKVSQDSLDGLAVKWTRTNGSKADRVKLANEARVLVDYLKADGADMGKAQALAETLAGEVLDGATYRDSALWDEYPELHRLEYTVNRNGSAKAELVKRYGSWSAAVAEARSHGVALRQADGVRDGNPAEQYESIVNDTRAVGGVQDGARALWKEAARQAGVEGSYSMESTEWLDVLMNLHDSIKPEVRSRFADEAEYEDARVELAGRMISDMMSVPEMTDAQAIFEGMQKQALQMAKAAAGDEAKAAEVEKGLQGVQKVQRQEFARRLAANQRTETLGAVKIDGRTFTNMGDLNEYMTYQREEFQRQLKQQEKRLKAQRQEDLDAAKLEYRERMGELREENDYLADQVKQEQRRADRAERSLMIQEQEIQDWDRMNQQKAAEWYQKQAERNAIALEVERQQRDEDVAIAKAVAEKRVQRARDARKTDELKRGIRANAAQLNQMVLRPQQGKYVQKGLIVEAAEVAKLANLVTLNHKAVDQLTRLKSSVMASMGSEGAPNAMTEDWKQSKVPELIQTLYDDLTATKNARLDKLHEQLAQAEALPDSEKARALQDRLRQRIRDTENRTYLPMTVDQLRILKAITSSTLHVIRTENKTLSLAKAEEVSAIAEKAAYEVKTSKGNRPGGPFDGLRNAATKYQLDMLGGERVFRMLGGYAKNGQMEKLAGMLNEGQRRQTEITIHGEKIFANVTGKARLKEMDAFAGPGAELVDIGLTDTKGNSVPLNHAMLCSLYMHLQNADSRNHLLNGGLTVPDMALYTKGNVERAYQEGQTVQLGMLKNADGTPMADNVLEAVENALTDYDRTWIADMQELFDNYTKGLINETSMQLLGYNRAEEKHYFPIAVDKSALATQIEGLNLDATIEGRGFLKNRVKKAVQPILLEECSSVVQRSIRDTAAYAGLALPIRDVQKVLNSNVETADGVHNLKNGILKEQWGRSAVEYVNDLLTDLQTKQRRRPSTANKVLDRLRGNYAGAILTLNPGVAIAQAASLPTAAAVLGSDTMAAVVPFVKNFSGKQRAALEAEIREHGDVLLDWRKRGSQRGELASIGKDPTLAEKAMDKLPKALTGWINGADEITVAALWEGSKAYVQNHAAEFAEGADKAGSEEYWQAVNQTYQKVIEQTQPNYTVMQRAGIQRNPDEFVKTFTMFTTQRFQNYGILADAVMDYNAQKERYRKGETEESRAELQRAGKQLQRAAASQVAQTAVFALMKIGADFLLHRWDREQDENGDVTLKSLLNRFTGLFTESAAGNFLYGSELYGLVNNALNGKDYDVVSATNISVVNDLAGDAAKFYKEWRKDTSDMDEEKLAAHHGKVQKYALALMEDGMSIAGVPFGNGKKILEAFKGYAKDMKNVADGGKFSFNSLPSSATGQYDRLYNAYASGDTAEAQAAMEKLQEMGKADEIYSQLKTRLKQYDANIQDAAAAQVQGSEEQRYRLEQQVIEQLYDTLGLRKGVKADAGKREAVIDCVTGAVNALADEQLKGGKKGSVTDDLVEAVNSGRAQDVQEELDRLLQAGKALSSLKSKITEVCKEQYLAGSDYDQDQLETLLLTLRGPDGKRLYDRKTIRGWKKAAKKTGTEADPYEALR